jgi:PAS domain S-box-containing protein
MLALSPLESGSESTAAYSLLVDDYLRRPVLAAELVARVRTLLEVRDLRARLKTRDSDQQMLFELTQALVESADIRDILFAVVARVAAFAHVDRCSVVLFGQAGKLGYVLATSDDEELRDLPIELRDYPEMREVLATGKALVIRDGSRHPVLELVLQAQPSIAFSSFALLPILGDRGPLGVLFLRSKDASSFEAHELSSIATLANTMAIALSNARVLQSLRDATENSRSARADAERRVQLFQRYADFFESAADGMMVIDREGKILFANPQARELTGFSESELRARKLEDFLAAPERERTARLIGDFSAGIYPRGLDLTILDKFSVKKTISVSFSSVLHENNAIVFSFRDVTRARATAIELAQTKEFLESVIESSVDAIVSADLRGTVLLFNRAAQRIFGYAPNDVVGKISVEKLYPPGVAKEIMRKIRDPAVSGYGRLEDHRVDMVNERGEAIQVLLSASLVIGNGRPVGSLGIFTDIRQKLRMEAELEKAQEALRAREKQALVAELAGAAAHELNQPLTSVIGYAELLKRQLEHQPTLLHAAEVIGGESERMAEIVRKIGKITKYETKSYVGAAKILDLDKATEEKP